MITKEEIGQFSTDQQSVLDFLERNFDNELRQRFVKGKTLVIDVGELVKNFPFNLSDTTTQRIVTHLVQKYRLNGWKVEARDDWRIVYDLVEFS